MITLVKIISLLLKCKCDVNRFVFFSNSPLFYMNFKLFPIAQFHPSGHSDWKVFPLALSTVVFPYYYFLSNTILHDLIIINKHFKSMYCKEHFSCNLAIMFFYTYCKHGKHVKTIILCYCDLAVSVALHLLVLLYQTVQLDRILNKLNESAR